ncbi:MAG: hypothetical protein V9E83_02350 [Baekduia sp.]
MRDRLIAALRALHADQRRVVACAALLLGSLLLPWYTQTTTVTKISLANGFPNPEVTTTADSRTAVLVPSFIEASIVLVTIAVIVLMVLRGVGANVVLPFSDRMLVTGAGAWSVLLVFWRFVDHPSSEPAPGTTVEWSLSWGIFCGLLCAFALVGSGLLLHDAGRATGGLHKPGPDDPA